jgi:uncharacterized protein
VVHRLVIFTRYPVPGQAKTRLIPALGEAGAAMLQRQMTEHTIAQVRRLQYRYVVDQQVDQPVDQPLEVEIWFATAEQSLSAAEQAIDKQAMQQWLGQDWHYRSQPQGDLGDRMSQAFQTAFNEGVERVVIIGTDCPELDSDRLLSAFNALSANQLVLGEATDGGYYLIGLHRTIPEPVMPTLFVGVDWGTSEVLAQTMAIALHHNIPVALLPVLSDVDYPADLAVWHRVRQSLPKLSIIMPVLNEADQIAAILREIKAQIQSSQVQLSKFQSTIEILIVDGGSQDRTVELVKHEVETHEVETQSDPVLIDITVIESPPGRARQMNAGAQMARGEILLFLHADTRLPDNFWQYIETTLGTGLGTKLGTELGTESGTELGTETVIAGAFELTIIGESLGLRWVEWGVKWRSRLFQLPYGDQAIFLRSAVFWQLGGFAEMPIMEDFELIQRLKKQGRVAIAPAAVQTSARRWQKLGIFKTTVINQLMLVGYRLGIPLESLTKLYRQAGKNKD